MNSLAWTKKLRMRLPIFIKPMLIPTAVLLTSLGLATGLWFLLEWHVNPATTEEKTQVLLLIAQSLGGLVLLGGLFFTWRNIRATEENVRNAQETATRNLSIAQEGQITERFTRAIEQLGNDKLQIRLGGIYALESIARDSEKDHWPIMEVLTAYVRENAPWKEDPLSQDTSREDIPDEGGWQRPRAPTDIQAILTVIGRRTRWYEHGEEQSLDFRQTDLRWADLNQAHLEGSNLTAAHLEEASLVESHLEGAHLYGAHLDGARLDQAHLEGATLIEAHLLEARLVQARMERAILYTAHVEKANLIEAHLERANLIDARLHGASLHDTHLDETHLEGADLSGATGLTRQQIESAYRDAQTKFPDYLRDYLEPLFGTQEDTTT